MATLLHAVVGLLGLPADYNANDRRRVVSILGIAHAVHSSVSVAQYKLYLQYATAHPRRWTPLREVLWQMHKVRSKL